MTLAELQQEVYTLTNRPALIAETLTAVRSATLKLHQLDYFYRDLFETGVVFNSSAYLQQIDYYSLVPRYRALKYIRKTDSTGQEQGTFFDVIPPETVLDQYYTNREDVCYVAGRYIQLRSSTEVQYVLWGMYLNPDISVATFDSWIAVQHPYAIVFEAAAIVFKAIGDTEQFAAYTQLAAQQAAEVKLSNIVAQGY